MVRKKLTREQKESVAILSIGTFLEYFDLMLYIHLAIVLNDLFFPKTDPITQHLLTATAFAMTYVLRPFGGIIIGRIGDSIGRKSTIIITSVTMSVACLLIATIGTYDEIGLLATVTIIFCRMLQGFSSLGEVMGATIYLSETLKSPNKYIASGIVQVFSKFGGLFALIVASMSISSGFSWRLAFIFGAFIAFIGIFARTRLRETPEFANYKLRMKIKSDMSYKYKTLKLWVKNKEKLDIKSILGLFFKSFYGAVVTYTIYIYIGDYSKDILNMTQSDILSRNFKMIVISIAATIFATYLCKKYHPVKILKATTYFAIAILLITPYLLFNITPKTAWLLIFIQFSLCTPSLNSLINVSLWLKNFPVDRRFTTTATTFGIGTASGYAISAFFVKPLIIYFGYYGIWVIILPVLIGFLYSVYYLQKLEIKNGSYDNYPNENLPYKDTVINLYNYNLSKEYDEFYFECPYSNELIKKLKYLSGKEGVNLNFRLIEKAMVFCKKWHSGQMRKIGNIPFYSHPYIVAGNIAEHYLKTDVIIASILHDVIEDSDCTKEIIEKEFNSRISDIVNYLTKVRYIDGEKTKMSLEETLAIMYTADEYEGFLIKYFDRLHNLTTIEGLESEKQKKIAEETNNFLVSMVALVADKLALDKKIDLENDIFKISHEIVK